MKVNKLGTLSGRHFQAEAVTGIHNRLRLNALLGIPHHCQDMAGKSVARRLNYTRLAALRHDSSDADERVLMHSAALEDSAVSNRYVVPDLDVRAELAGSTHKRIVLDVHVAANLDGCPVTCRFGNRTQALPMLYAMSSQA